MEINLIAYKKEEMVKFYDGLKKKVFFIRGKFGVERKTVLKDNVCKNKSFEG